MRSIGIAGLQLPLAPGDNLERIAAEVALVKARLPWVEMVVVGELAMFGASASPRPSPCRAQPRRGCARRPARPASG